jgi:hypothetical protein
MAAAVPIHPPEGTQFLDALGAELSACRRGACLSMRRWLQRKFSVTARQETALIGWELTIRTKNPRSTEPVLGGARLSRAMIGVTISGKAYAAIADTLQGDRLGKAQSWFRTANTTFGCPEQRCNVCSPCVSQARPSAT